MSGGEEAALDGREDEEEETEDEVEVDIETDGAAEAGVR